jgi:hypothetical protein
MVEFGPDTTYGRNTAWYPIPGHYQNITIQVAGMKASTTYHMRSQVQCAASDDTVNGPDVTFQTGALPSLPFPTLTVSRPNPVPSSPENPGIEMVDITTAGTPAFFTDRDANPIWYYDVGAANFPYTFKLLPNGHMILSITTNINAPTVSLLREIDLAGNTIRELPVNSLGEQMQAAGYDFVPQSFSHDFVPLDNGHLVVLTNFTRNVEINNVSTPVIGDALVDLDENWNPVWAWNSFDYLDVNRHLSGLPDWTHGNGLVYSASDGNLLLSLRHQSWILKIDYNNGAGTGKVLWRLGYQGDFNLTQGSVPAIDDPSLWFSFQHFPSIVSQSGAETTLAVWDNGDSRVLDTSGDICPSYTLNIPCYSKATILQLDESVSPPTANLLWTFLPGPYNFSLWGGSINQLDNGNVEFDLNSPAPPPIPNLASEVQEVTQTSSPVVIWKMDISPITANAYRAYRVPSLYPGVNWQY